MSKRDDWTLWLPAATVLTAVLAKQKFHLDRVVHWVERREAAKKDLQKNGIELVEAPDGSYTMANAPVGNGRHFVRVDPEKQRAFDAAAGGVKRNEERANDYGRYVYFLQTMLDNEPKAVLELSVDDVHYFQLQDVL